MSPVAYGPGLAERIRAAAPDGITAVQDNNGRETVKAGLGLGIAPERICTIVDYAAVAEFGILTPGRYTRSPGALADLADLVAAGLVVVPLQQVFPFSEAVEPFRRMETGHLRGKVVVSVA